MAMDSQAKQINTISLAFHHSISTMSHREKKLLLMWGSTNNGKIYTANFEIAYNGKALTHTTTTK